VTRGRSVRVYIDGVPVLLANLDGLTDGTPPELVHYTAREPGQTFIREDP
jgi:hypothetical protein